MKRKIIDEMIKFAATDEGQRVLKELSSVTGLVPATDKDYDATRAAVKSLGNVVGDSGS